MKTFITFGFLQTISCRSEILKTDVIIENQPPEVLSLEIIPSAEITSSTALNCTATATDPDDDSMSIDYQWLDQAGAVLAEGSDLQLSPELVQPTETVTCLATITTEEHSVTQDTLITVENSVPLIDAITLSPEFTYSNSLLSVEVLSSDPDQEALSTTFLWTRNGTLIEEGDSTLQLTPEQYSTGDEIQCAVTITDGFGGEATELVYTTIENVLPVVGTVILSPSPAHSFDDIICLAQQIVDLEGADVSISYQWYIDSILQIETTDTLSAPFLVNTEIQCTVTPHDGIESGEAQSASLYIENTPPEIDILEISPSIVYADTLVSCLAEASDLDQELTTTTYEWMLSTTILGQTATLQLDPTLISVEEELTCIATVTDPQSASISSSVSTIIINSLPIVDVAATITGSPTTNETLECISSFNDINDGQLFPSHLWVDENGTTLGTNATYTINPAQTNPGDELTCTAAVLDAHGGTISSSASILVDNTPPVISDLSISELFVYTNDQIEIVVLLSDTDEDQVLSKSIEWHVLDSSNGGLDTVVQTSSSMTLDGQFFDKGDQVYAVVTPFDSVDFGPSQTSVNVDVLNSLPSAISLSMSPSSPRLELDDVECTVPNPSLDLDGDVVEYIYDWLDSAGQTIQSTQTSLLTDILTASSLSIPDTITCRVTPFDGEDFGSSVETSVSVEFDCNCPQTTNRDFAFTYWPENFRNINFNLYGFYTVRNFLTGYYGAVIDMSNGSILNIAQISNLNLEDAALSDDSWLQAGLSSEVSYSVEVNGVTWNATDFLNSDETGNHGEDNPSKLMDMGRFQQHIEIPELLYQGNTDLLGSLSIVSTPQHLVLTHRTSSATSYSGAITIQTSFSGDLWAQSQVSALDGTRAIELLDTDGVSWVLIAPNSTDSISQESDGSIVVSRTVANLSVGQEISIPVLIVPADQVSLSQVMMYLDPENTVEVTFAQMNQTDALTTGIQDAYWDWERGAFTVPLGSIQGSGASSNSTNWSNGTDFNLYNRHQLEIVHSSPDPIHVPLFLDGPINTTFNITGGSPLFRSTNEEPTGLPIQVSKNWHEPGYWPNWFHMYSTPSVPTGSHSMELTVAIGKWGETFAASHAQLSLVGWGANQQWDESALGAWGESITYDPDKTLRRAMVDDVRPFLMEVNGQYNWTGNVGGADFLKYVDLARPLRDQQPTQLKTTYTAPGPVMTDVTYSGITDDDAITLSTQTHLVRTDDIVRAYYILHYEFVQDVEYARLGLFQIAADNYSDNGFTKYAYGDSTGVLFDDVVPNHNTSGYASDADRGIELTGEHPWVFMYDSAKTGGNLPEHVADVGFIVRQYSANINGTQTLNPHININRTRNGGWSQMAFELGIPFDANNVLIEAGSTIDAIVEYIVVPNDISLYYGPSTDMANVDPTLFGTTDIIELLASTNAIEITPSIGTLAQIQPTIINGIVDTVSAQFEMEGGFGYSPITIQGLFRGDGWQLQNLNNGVWSNVDQSVHGNDYWQTRFDEESGTYALTFSVNTDIPTEFRLVR